VVIATMALVVEMVRQRLPRQCGSHEVNGLDHNGVFFKAESERRYF